jgi:hypothetical protein
MRVMRKPKVLLSKCHDCGAWIGVVQRKVNDPSDYSCLCCAYVLGTKEGEAGNIRRTVEHFLGDDAPLWERIELEEATDPFSTKVREQVHAAEDEHEKAVNLVKADLERRGFTCERVKRYETAKA